MESGIKKNSKKYYTYKEILELIKKAKNSEYFKLNGEGIGSYPISLSELNVTSKELAKEFFSAYFEQDFNIIEQVSNGEYRMINVFDLEPSYGETSSVETQKVYINGNYMFSTFNNLVLSEEENIFQTVEYVHEVGHCLVERNNEVDDQMLEEVIPILLELLFAYDIDTDINNYFYTGRVLINKYNHCSSAIKYGENKYELNYATFKFVMQQRVTQLLTLKEMYLKEKSKENKYKYSKYLKSIEEAMYLFESFLYGNLSVISYLDDVLKGNMNVSELVHECKEEYKKIL